ANIPQPWDESSPYASDFGGPAGAPAANSPAPNSNERPAEQVLIPLPPAFWSALATLSGLVLWMGIRRLLRRTAASAGARQC
ncbi:MAG TPA: hypothetical protein VGV35_18750, partial [Bryobacteraceae bacterium]|nr:hypothetical protein [Bryobacteraceae bacterium]